MKTTAPALLACLITFASAQASTIHVPGEQPTIHAGLNAASSGDTVLVAPGTYLENIVWPTTQNIYLKSESGPESTIIDGGSPSHPDTGSVVFFNAGQDESTVLDGFTITNGSGTLHSFPEPSYKGGGIWLSNASPTIAGNIIIGNTHSRIGIGGGIASEDSSPIISGNRISNNRATDTRFGFGGGVFCGGMLCYPCSAAITDNKIAENTARWGAGIAAFDSSPVIDKNTISSNTATVDGGGVLFRPGFFGAPPGCAPVITANTIISNTGGIGGGISGYGPTGDEDPRISGNVVTGNTGGGIMLDAEYGPNRAMIESCVVSDNSAFGMRLSNGATPNIERCLVSQNNGDGILCISASSPTIRYSDFLDHAPYYGVINTSSTVTIDAELNWWGDASGPTHSGNPGGLGDRVSDYVDYTPWTTSSGVAESDSQVPRAQLGQNRPNPFNPTTEITFELPVSAAVRLSLHDAGGRVVQMLLNSEARSAGSHTISWDGRDESGRTVPSGVYFYRLDAGPYSETRRMVLAR